MDRWIVSPAELWIAPVGTAFPDIDVTPSGSWAKLGVAGKFDYAEDGITITHGQTIDQYFGLGSTGPVKASRSQEQLTIEGVLQDTTLESYAKILNGVTVTAGTTTASMPTKEINLRQGLTVKEYALLVRTVSPYDPSKPRQYEIPRVYQSAEPAPVYSKSNVAALAFTFTALEDTNAATEAERFGHIVDGSAT